MRRSSKYKFRIIISVLFIIFISLIFISKVIDIPHRILVELAIFIVVGGILLCLVGRWESHVRDAEEKIEQSRKLLLVILEGSPVAILLVKKDKVVWASKSIKDILGWPVEKWLNESSMAFCYPGQKEFVRVSNDIIYKDIARKGRIAYEYDYVHKNGHRVPTIVKIRALDKDNLEEGIIFSVIDNSDRKKTGEVIKKLNQELEQKVEARTKELAEKISELERFKEVTVDRELRMKELRDEIEELKKVKHKAE